jgi:serralysin
MATVVPGGALPLSIDMLDVGLLFQGPLAPISSTHIQTQSATDPITVTDLFGTFTLGSSPLVSGTITEMKITVAGVPLVDITGLNVSASDLVAWAAADDNATAKSTILAGDDLIFGTPFSDVLRGYGGDDTFVASGGSDDLDGGSGVNTLVFHGAFANYRLGVTADGTWSSLDLRSGAPDGSDRFFDIQRLQFTDRTVIIGETPSSVNLQLVQAQFSQVFRETVDQALGTSPELLSGGASVANPVFAAANQVTPLALQLDAGLVTAAASAATLASLAIATASVATLAYEFFTGSAPTAAGMDYLVSPTGPNANNLNSAYYQSFGLENRYINFAVNLGKVGAGDAAFSSAYGSLSLFDATRQAYATIFGATPSDTKLHALLDPTTVLNGQTFSRADYFAYYGGDGANGLGTKAAMVGWLLAEAEKADVGTYALSNDAFLTDVALHNAPFGVDLVGHYAQPGFVFNPG